MLDDDVAVKRPIHRILQESRQLRPLPKVTPAPSKAYLVRFLSVILPMYQHHPHKTLEKDDH